MKCSPATRSLSSCSVMLSSASRSHLFAASPPGVTSSVKLTSPDHCRAHRRQPAPCPTLPLAQPCRYPSRKHKQHKGAPTPCKTQHFANPRRLQRHGALSPPRSPLARRQSRHEPRSTAGMRRPSGSCSLESMSFFHTLTDCMIASQGFEAGSSCSRRHCLLSLARRRYSCRCRAFALSDCACVCAHGRQRTGMR